VAALGERDEARRIEAMVARHGPALLRVAHQFSLCHDDALDAYQRTLEIYLRRLDTVDRATEGAWLRVVVKHEAMAIRNARAASVDADDIDFDDNVAGLREIEDTVAGGERVDRSVEALKALKPDEARALLLKAEGLSYDEIGRRFGWTYTKVNRSIAEGRKRFLKIYRGIEAGEACERYTPVLDALADGTATSAQVLAIRPHLRHCATCRATVRNMRFSRTRRIALLAPFAWVSRLLSRSDVVQYASSGGGRLGPIAGVVGLCLSGVGAGAACVMSGALPAAPILAHHEAKPAPTPINHRTKKHVRIVPTKRRPAAPTVKPPPRVYASFTATPVPRPKKKVVKPKVARRRAVTTRIARTTVTRRQTARATATPSEFGVEGANAGTAAPRPTVRVATAASAPSGGGSAPTRTSSGGGGGARSGGSSGGGGDSGGSGGSGSGGSGGSGGSSRASGEFAVEGG
jgi:RNA polymerase sigma factor (sigma-70 family)